MDAYKKKYKEALEKARQLCAYPTTKPFVSDLQDLFPELKESEDDRIRKAIIELVREKSEFYGNEWRIGDYSEEQVIAWLKKQGEQNPTLPKWKYKKDHTPLLRDSIILNKYGCVAKSPSGALVSDVWVLDYDELAKLPKEELEKQGEQKLADKVIKPKFHEGEWIIRNAEGFKHDTYLIKEVKDYYVCEELEGRRVTFTFNDVHKNFKLWDISDVKSGDVLAEDTCLFIIKKLNHDLSAKIYCCLYDDGDFEINSNLVFDDTSTYPATKEQRDTLFAKMKENGYEWSKEAHELKKISQRTISAEAKEALFDNPAWSIEDGKSLNRIVDALESMVMDYNVADAETLDKDISWLKSLKQRIGG